MIVFVLDFQDPLLATTKFEAVKHGAILYNEAAMFSLSITNLNGRPLLPFDWLIHSGLVLARCHKIFCGREGGLNSNS